MLKKRKEKLGREEEGLYSFLLKALSISFMHGFVRDLQRPLSLSSLFSPQTLYLVAALSDFVSSTPLFIVRFPFNILSPDHVPHRFIQLAIC